MMNLKKNINSKISELGFDVVGYTKPVVDIKTRMEYKKFLKKNFMVKWAGLKDITKKK